MTNDRSLRVLIICSTIVLIGVIATGVGWFLNLLAPILTPFIVGAFLAYMGDPLADRLEARKCSRMVSVLVVFLAIILLLILAVLLIIPSIQAQVVALTIKIPEYKNQVFNNWIPWGANLLGIDPKVVQLSQLKELMSQDSNVLQGVFGKLLGSVFGSSLFIVQWLANIILIPVVTFYLLRDWDDIVAKVRVLLPRKVEPTIVHLAQESNQVLGNFIRGQVMVMISLSIIYFIGLKIIGLDLALLIGVTAGMISFVPYLGCIVGIVLAIIAALLQFGDITNVIYVCIVFGVGQALEGMVLTPKLVGDKIGLHSVAVIFAVMAGGQLFGFFGILIALPAAAVIMVLLRYVYNLYMDSNLYGDDKVGEEENSESVYSETENV